VIDSLSDASRHVVKRNVSTPAPPVRQSSSTAPESHGDVLAIYDDAFRTIDLPWNWTGATPVDSTRLVREMVHHLQNVVGMMFACAGAREKDAYRAQRAWLALFGRTPEQEFGLDPMTILLRTNCLY